MYDFLPIARLIEILLGINRRDILFRYAKSQIGIEKKGIPDTAPKEVNCVEALNQIGIECFGKPFCYGASTITLETVLRGSTRFQLVKMADARPGDIIVSPTSGSKIGHTGIVSDDGKIMSNKSATGLWSEHWTVVDWCRVYGREYGLPVEFFRVVF